MQTLLEWPAQPAVINAGRTRSGQAWLPSLADCLFMALVLILFGGPGGWESLLSDGDTGWHIRTGEHILRTGAIPATDIFSFTKGGQPWFAWEWGADVVFAAAHAAGGLRAVVFLSGMVLGCAGLVLFRYMMWRGAGLHVAVAIAVCVMDASRIHFLARPHIFTLLLIPVSLWMIERDMERPRRATWLLVPLAALWTNLHGGFLVLIATLAVFALSSCIQAWTGTEREQDLRRAARLAVLAAACMAATLANPNGAGLYMHIVPYLQSDWILNAINEFQSPQFRSESLRKFEILLIAGLCTVPSLLRRRQFGSAGLILLWAHEALTSVRHVPIYAFVAAAPISTELTNLWRRWTAGCASTSAPGAMREIFSDLGIHARRTSVWAPAFVLLLYIATPAGKWPTDFPADRFPAGLLARNAGLWTAPEAPARILSSDSWGGYLIYKLHPQSKVFMDGRSDLYGEKLGRDYLCLRSACDEWPELIGRSAIDSVLIPKDWALASALRKDTQWRQVDQDDVAVWFVRRTVHSGNSQ